MRRAPYVFLCAGFLILAGCTAGQTDEGIADTSSSSSAVPCTMEAKLCPDGSTVGRTGPDCAFAPCPGGTSSDSSSVSASVSDGTIAFSRPADFGLAVTDEQILVDSYIPPCEPGIAYCLYYLGKEYEGTNFDSAGLGILKRADNPAQDDCLATPPSGYEHITPLTYEGDGYATSVFSPLGDAGAGHYTHDRVYRLFADGSCYAFTTRIGASQFANYPAGEIEEFTSSDEAAVQAKLDAILHGMTLHGNAIRFPSIPQETQM